MSKQDFELKEKEIRAIADDKVKYPHMPVDIALQESEDLLVWCLPDKELLEKAELDWSLVTDLGARTGACRYLQSLWQKESRSIEQAQKVWKEKSPEAYKIRDELIRHFNFAFYKSPDLRSQIKKIAKGGSHADMIQDLSDLSALGKANLHLLTCTPVDNAMLDLAAKTSAEMSVVLAKSNEQKMQDKEMRLLRDKAFAYMKVAVDEIRRCGQYVFRKDKQRFKGYISRYNKAKRNSKSKPEVWNVGANPESN